MYTFSTSQFRFNKESRKLTAEMSSLGLPPGIHPRQFEMVSAHTAKRLDFSFFAESTARGELLGIIYRNEPADLFAVLHND